MPAEGFKDHLELIADRIFECRCVPFLGAGANVSRAKPEYRGLPLGSAVAAELAKRIEFEGNDPTNLPRVALQYRIRKDHPDLMAKLKEIIQEDKCEPSPLLRVLARLPFRLMVSTNYDRLLERALDERNKDELVRDYVTIVQSDEGVVIQSRDGQIVEGTMVAEKLTELERFDGVLFYKLHGTFRDIVEIENEEPEDPSRIVVTEDDYISFLTVARTDTIGVPRLIAKNLTPNTLLFLGYSLEDWDFRTIHRGLIRTLTQHSKRQSFAIQKKPADYWVKFWDKQGVTIYDMDLYDFADQLEAKYLERYGHRLDENKCRKRQP
jgi:hypothetical protein